MDDMERNEVIATTKTQFQFVWCSQLSFSIFSFRFGLGWVEGEKKEWNHFLHDKRDN